MRSRLALVGVPHERDPQLLPPGEIGGQSLRLAEDDARRDAQFGGEFAHGGDIASGR